MKFLLVALGLLFTADCAVRRRPIEEAEPVEAEPLEPEPVAEQRERRPAREARGRAADYYEPR